MYLNSSVVDTQSSIFSYLSFFLLMKNKPIQTAMEPISRRHSTHAQAYVIKKILKEQLDVEMVGPQFI